MGQPRPCRNCARKSWCSRLYRPVPRRAQTAKGKASPHRQRPVPTKACTAQGCTVGACGGAGGIAIGIPIQDPILDNPAATPCIAADSWHQASQFIPPLPRLAARAGSTALPADPNAAFAPPSPSFVRGLRAVPFPVNMAAPTAAALRKHTYLSPSSSAAAATPSPA